jgi:hypothetical protein
MVSLLGDQFKIDFFGYTLMTTIVMDEKKYMENPITLEKPIFHFS